MSDETKKYVAPINTIPPRAILAGRLFMALKMETKWLRRLGEKSSPKLQSIKKELRDIGYEGLVDE